VGCRFAHHPFDYPMKLANRDESDISTPIKGSFPMKVVVFVKASSSSEAGAMPSQQLLTDMGAYNEELVHAGIMKDGAGLHPSSKGVRVRFSGKDRTVINGPFAETKELVAGYWIWEVKSLEDAISWLKKCPNPMPEDSEVEIRPLLEASDFGEEFTPELREKEAQLETTISMSKATVQPYLFFAGRCEEALEFYKGALQAKVLMLMRFNESPDPTPPGMLAPGFENKVMHCSFQVGAVTLMASDGCDDKSRFDGFRLALTVATEADAERVFEALAQGGKVDMPLVKTFWSPRYGMVTDQFGVAWMVMVPGPMT
jgi:PhnB protein